MKELEANCVTGPYRHLDEIPAEKWTTARPPEGNNSYTYRTATQIAGLNVDTLLDSGAACNVVTEEIVLKINQYGITNVKINQQ